MINGVSNGQRHKTQQGPKHKYRARGYLEFIKEKGKGKVNPLDVPHAWETKQNITNKNEQKTKTKQQTTTTTTQQPWHNYNPMTSKTSKAKIGNQQLE